MALANTYRTAIQSVLMKRYADTELCLIDEQFARNIFAGSDAAQETKSRAASILVYLLQWGGDNGHCRRPSFDYSIARKPEVKPADKPKGRKKPQEVIKPQKNTEDTESKSVESVESVGKTKPQITQKDTEEKIDTDNLLNTDYKDYKETAAEQPQANPSVKSIKSVLNKKSVSDKNICDTQKSPCESVSSVAKEESAAKPKRIIRKVDDDICQLDPKTLEVIRKWPHAHRINQELGIGNVVRAIGRCGIAGGFYWTYSKDLDTFAARLAARQQHNAQAHADHCAQMRAAKEPQTNNKPQNTQKAASKREESEARIDSHEREQARPQGKDTEKKSVKSVKSVGKKKAAQSVSSVANKRSAAQAALDVFTDDELFAELDRRGWFGYFSRTEIVTIGTK